MLGFSRTSDGVYTYSPCPQYRVIRVGTGKWQAFNRQRRLIRDVPPWDAEDSPTLREAIHLCFVDMRQERGREDDNDART